MNQATVVYAAIRQTRRPDGASARCCTDDPRRPVDDEATPGRWRKLASAVPASVRAFRGSLREPANAPSPAVGSRVETAAGTPIGLVQDLMIGVESGRQTYAVAASDPEDGDKVVYLVPRGALRRGRDENVVVIDERRLAARERATGRLVG